MIPLSILSSSVSLILPFHLVYGSFDSIFTYIRLGISCIVLLWTTIQFSLCMFLDSFYLDSCVVAAWIVSNGFQNSPNFVTSPPSRDPHTKNLVHVKLFLSMRATVISLVSVSMCVWQTQFQQTIWSINNRKGEWNAGVSETDSIR